GGRWVAEVAVAAVVFGLDRADHGAHRRTALVLGAGGVLGAAWMTGALARLQDRLPGPAGDVDVIIGTSAGSVLAAALRCHAPFEEMMAWQRGQATGILSESVALAAQDSPLPPLPRWRFGSVSLARAALLTPHRVPPWVGASAWLPHGRGQHAALRSLVGALHLRHHQQAAPGAAPPHWVSGPTWLCAVDYDTGQRVLFGQQDAPHASLTEAVVASCSIPGWYEPTVIGGRRYVDGGVRSPTSLGVLSGTDVQEVFVLAPMASTEPDRPLQPHLQMERRLRRVITMSLLRAAKALCAEGKRVTVLTPGPRDLAAMGINLMDPRRREAVLELSLRTSADALGGLGGLGGATSRAA
ncbi:MAG TPA: patatin-like phospholipase family protein, partial [Streptosporangiaceae bacterium]|nr:patatin-like phospholipase family protein [Streptosporangiaceae bacterium]